MRLIHPLVYLLVNRKDPVPEVLVYVRHVMAKLVAKAVKRGAAYEWEMSSDGGKTWVTVAKSTVANTTVSGLVAGTLYMFRFRSTVGQVTSAPCNAIPFLAS